MSDAELVVREEIKADAAARRTLPPGLLAGIMPLWVTGLALLLILLARHTHLGPFNSEWVQYLLLGTAFPALLLAYRFVPQWYRPNAVGPSFVKAALAGFSLVLGIVYLARCQKWGVFAVGLAILQMATMAAVAWRSRRQGAFPSHTLDFSFVQGRRDGGVWPALILFACSVSWAAARRLAWWPNPVHTRFTLIVFIVALALVVWNLFTPSRSRAFSRPRDSGANVLAICFFIAASLQTFGLYNFNTIHHSGVWTSPAAMVRQGGWLLWNVPSQYGFLTILTIAWLPFHSVWQSLYVAIAATMAISAAVIFFTLRFSGRGWSNYLFSVLVAWVAVFLMPGFANILEGPIGFPGVSAYRFFWCYLLIGILVWELRSPAEAERAKFFCGGTIAWLLGTLWSSESAIYCTAIWLPALAAMLWRYSLRETAFPGESAKRRGSVWTWLLLPPTLFLLTWLAIAAYYFARLHHSPDFSAFIEYGRSFQAGFSAFALDPLGSVWVLVLSLCAASATGILLLKRGLAHPALSLLVGVWGLIWATSSYFVMRSHPNNVNDLFPIFIAGFAALLLIFAMSGRCGFRTKLIKSVMVPILVVAITATIGNKQALRGYLSSVRKGYDPNIARKLPPVDPALMSLLTQAHVKSTDPVAYFDLNVMPAWTGADGRTVDSPKTWLPIMPYALLQPLSPSRQSLYIRRFASSTRLSGWLIEPKTHIDLMEGAAADLAETPDQTRERLELTLLKTYRPMRVLENKDYRLTWYQLR